MDRVIQGLTVKEIAQDMRLGPRSIATFLGYAKAKLKARNVAHASALWAVARAKEAA